MFCSIGKDWFVEDKYEKDILFFTNIPTGIKYKFNWCRVERVDWKEYNWDFTNEEIVDITKKYIYKQKGILFC